jgi:hypothetical protein
LLKESTKREGEGGEEGGEGERKKKEVQEVGWSREGKDKREKREGRWELKNTHVTKEVVFSFKIFKISGFGSLGSFFHPSEISFSSTEFRSARVIASRSPISKKNFRNKICLERKLTKIFSRKFLER